MKRIFLGIFIISMLSANIAEVKRLQWIDPYGRNPTRYGEWKRGRIQSSITTHIGTVYKKEVKSKQNVVNVIVNTSIYADIASEIDIFTNDLVTAGYSVQLDTINGMSHSALRAHLTGVTDLVGAIFIGEIPVAWFETNGFGEWEEFPHDLYFSDLDGIYIDADGDSIYDDHTGDVEPEIWVGRIYARNLTWDNEIRLLKRYFRKNHLYRVDSLVLPQRALSFVDDNWSYWTTCGLDYIYSDVVVVNDEDQTTAARYRDELEHGYEWIHVCAHSSPWGHTFMSLGGYRGTVFNYEIFTLEPQALFYNLFACSGTRFTEENGSAGWYLFVDPYGLLVVGSTKTGSMLYFDDFYRPIGQQVMCIGDAFKEWFTLWGEESWDWFYGMNIIGDPTLKPKNQTSHRIAQKPYASSQHNALWDTPETVASDPESDGFPQVTTTVDGKTWVVWESGRSSDVGRSEIYGAYRDTSTWSDAMNIGTSVYWDFNPVIGKDNQHRPVAVWAGFNDGQYDLYYSIYTGQWSLRQLLHSSDPAYDIKPTLAQDNDGNLWVTWESRRDVDVNIYASFFNGSSWSPPQQVTADPTDETTPHMLIDSLGQPWVIYARRFNDRSEIWGSYYSGNQWVASGPISGSQRRAYHPTGVVDILWRKYVWVAWQSVDSSNPDIFASYFNGMVWSQPTQLTSDTASDLFPCLAADRGGQVVCFYQSKADGDWNIYCVHPEDSTTWSIPYIVVDLAGADINPDVTCSPSNNLWICWQSYSTGNWEIMVLRKAGLDVRETKHETMTSSLSVAPTIFSRQVKIMTQAPYQHVCIYDIKGSLVKRISSGEDKRVTWNAQGLPAGAYFIVVKDNNQVISKKVLFLN